MSAETRRAGYDGPALREVTILEVGRVRRVTAVPVLHAAVFRLEETEETAVRTVAEHVAANLNFVASLDVLLVDADTLEAVATRRFKRPDLRLAALRILHLEIHPGVREQKVYFLHHAGDVGERVDI